MDRPLVKLPGDRPEARWLIFPTPNLLALYLRRTKGRWGYSCVWIDVQGFGLHCVTWEALKDMGGVPNQYDHPLPNPTTKEP